MPNRTVETRRFIAKTEAGKVYTIIEKQEMIAAPTFQDPRGELPGQRSFVTATGQHVDYVSTNTFKVVETGETLRKV